MRDRAPLTDISPAAGSNSVPAERGGPGSKPLPRSRSPLIGRAQEIATVRSLLERDDVSLVTLTGPGGVGKTRIVLSVATAVADEWQERLSFVELASIQDAELVLPAIARALGLLLDFRSTPVEQIAHFFGADPYLLILDNLEQVIESAVQIADLLTQCPGLKMLVTSRIVLRLSGEYDVPVGPLPIADATTLFARRAEAIALGFTLSEANTAIVEAICTRLDGLPLAIELAAARTAVLPTKALLERLDRVLPILTAGSRDRPERLQTMRAAIAWSHNLLSDDEQTLFRRLAVFVGGFTLEAAEYVGGRYAPGGRPAGLRGRRGKHCLLLLPLERSDPPPSPSVLDGVASLIDKSLVLQVGDHQEAVPRYRMLETIREFGLEQLAASEEIEDVRRAHAEFYARLTAQAEPELTGADQLTWLERLEAEHANLRAALAWVIAHDPPTGLRMAGDMIRFWDHHSHVREGQQWLEAALTRSGDLPSAPRAKALWGAGVLADGAGDYDRAERYLTESVELAREAGDQHYLGFALGALGAVALHHGDLERAVALPKEGLAHVRAAGDNDAIAALLNNLAHLAFFQGDYAGAVARSEESLTLYRVLGSVHGTSSALGYLGRALLELGEHERAQTVLREGLVLSQRVGNKWYAIATLEGLAAVATIRGEWRRAARLFGAVEALAESIGFAVHPTDRAINERHLASVRARLDEAMFAAVWAAGKALSLEQVIVEALEVADPAEVETLTPAEPDRAPAAGLTAREAEVLRLLAAGLSDREIAESLSLSPRTIGGHVTNLLTKLDLDSRTAAAVFAVRHGLA